MQLTAEICDRIAAAVSRQRLVETASALCAIYSPTGRAGEVSDRLAEILAADGFTVKRPHGGHPAAPAVAVRYAAPQPGRTLQFDGHLDTVHLPFVPPTVEADRITGSGAADMKAPLAAAVEALRALRDGGLLPAGSILLTAHDLHEAPWGDGSQLERLIEAGYVGDGVLIPEYLRDVLAIAGRGQAVWKLRIARPGAPVHEVYRPDEPSVISAAARWIARLDAFSTELASRVDERVGAESVFIGQVHAGEIYNQFPQECRLEGTRRWLPSARAQAVEAELRELAAEVARQSGAALELSFQKVRDAYWLDLNDPLVAAFQAAYGIDGEPPLPQGSKPFVDDGNTFWSQAQVAAITHGPRGGGAHTLSEWVSIDELVRVARVFAATAVAYC